jgi:RHS repeat-associated protein
VNSGFMLDVKSYSFYHRSSTTGYTNYQLLVNGILVGSGSIFVSSGTTLQSTGTINVANAIAGLTGSVSVTLKLFGGSNGNNATFRLDDFTLNGYTQEVQVYAEGYRRGFNGMEKDDEVKGGGNSYDFGARMYDARVGRFLSLDNFTNKFAYKSPYDFAGNTPICAIDANGDSVLFVTKTGRVLGYSNDNQRYKGQNLIVIISDKNIETFRNEYNRKRSRNYKEKNKLSDNQVEQHIAGLEAMGLSFDATDIVSFYFGTEAKNVKDDDGYPSEWYAPQTIINTNSFDKGGSIGVDEKLAKPYSKDTGIFPPKKFKKAGDAHSHTLGSKGEPDMSISPTFGDDKHSKGNDQNSWSFIVRGDEILFYQRYNDMSNVKAQGENGIPVYNSFTINTKKAFINAKRDK